MKKKSNQNMSKKLSVHVLSWKLDLVSAVMTAVCALINA